MRRLHPGAEAVISWEPDGSPEVMTVMTSSPEPLWEHLDWDNCQPDYTCDWDCLTMHTFVPCPQFFCLLKAIADVCTMKMAEVLTLSPPTSCPEPCNKKPSFSAHLTFRGWWSDLVVYGISGVWVLGPKIWFQFDSVSNNSPFNSVTWLEPSCAQVASLSLGMSWSWLLGRILALKLFHKTMHLDVSAFSWAPRVAPQ
jgi:hypothetical protein